MVPRQYKSCTSEQLPSRFKSTIFHFRFLTTEVAISIGETLGVVAIPKNRSEMRGGNFMRVRVVIDITKALCKGRRVSWSLESEGWVSFKYERLPNLCYWCGELSHDDKDCTLSLQSKGSLAVEDRQFGLWIRAAQFNQSKKTVVEVQGYEGPTHKSQNQPGNVSQNTNSQLDSTARGMHNEVNQLLLRGATAVQSGPGEAGHRKPEC